MVVTIALPPCDSCRSSCSRCIAVVLSNPYSAGHSHTNPDSDTLLQARTSDAAILQATAHTWQQLCHVTQLDTALSKMTLASNGMHATGYRVFAASGNA